jgi:hypothetical protein
MTNDTQQRNLDTLAPLSDSDANGRFFAARAEQRGEIVQQLKVLVRQINTEREHDKTEVELLCDDWVFHRGPADTEEKKNRMFSDVNALRLRQRVREKLQNRTGHTDSSSLMDGFEGGEFGELPSDADILSGLRKR